MMNNFSRLVRALWLPTMLNQVFMATPLTAALMDRRLVKIVDGDTIRRTMEIDELTDEAQTYTMEEPLTSGERTLVQNVQFPWKWWQMPIKLTAEEKLLLNSKSTAPVTNLAKLKVRKAQRGARLRLNKMIWGTWTGGTYNDTKAFLSIWSALKHDGTYGQDRDGSALTRATTVTNAWWQSGSITGGYADQATDYGISIDTLRQMEDTCMHKIDGYKPSDMMLLCSSTVFRKLQAQAEARRISTSEGRMMKYGFRSLSIDDLEVVVDPFLNTQPWGTASTYDTKKWMTLLHLPSWELRFHKQRAMTMTPWRWQGEISGGTDEYISRILSCGNFVCWQPNANCGLLNVT